MIKRYSYLEQLTLVCIHNFRLPKATVQAALGPLALDNAKSLGSDREDGPQMVAYGEKVSISLLSSFLNVQNARPYLGEFFFNWSSFL